ncbi:hypothetical protein AB0C29_29545 [Actinoplanes sp. NPDC048791]|uniref:hypothetical protein n=1 Tax=Actinoplanes sp. NPDC048791 TaxID=3154623 RepID=UPI0033C60FE8
MSRTPEASGVEVDDRTVGGLLAYHALIEIRALAGKPSRQPGTVNTDEVLAEIRTLADRAHNLPLGPRPQGRWRSTRAACQSPGTGHAGAADELHLAHHGRAVASVDAAAHL